MFDWRFGDILFWIHATCGWSHGAALDGGGEPPDAGPSAVRGSAFVARGRRFDLVRRSVGGRRGGGGSVRPASRALRSQEFLTLPLRQACEDA